jgi:short-subunit dehydrogenase
MCHKRSGTIDAGQPACADAPHGSVFARDDRAAQWAHREHGVGGGADGPPGLTAYNASKFGLRGFSEALHADVRQHNIDVIVVYPFYTRTPILQSPQYGSKQASLPDWLLYEPEFVVAAVLDGVRRRKLHVYPGAIPRWIDVLNRLAPWLLPLVVRAPRAF